MSLGPKPFGRDMRVADPSRAVADVHLVMQDDIPRAAHPAGTMTIHRWIEPDSERIAVYLFAKAMPIALCFLPTPEELVETGKAMIALGEAKLAEAEQAAADALAKARRP